MGKKYETVFDLAYRMLKPELDKAADIIRCELKKKKNKKILKRLMRKRKVQP